MFSPDCMALSAAAPALSGNTTLGLYNLTAIYERFLSCWLDRCQYQSVTSFSCKALGTEFLTEANEAWLCAAAVGGGAGADARPQTGTGEAPDMLCAQCLL